MKLFIIISEILIIACLIAERNSAVRHRRALKHVVHVNGTRGKSSVTRLIAAGLTAGGYRVFCKTTGTLPMTIDPEGSEKEIKRRGPANIKEQIWALKQAAEAGADVLVVECMAVNPELQYVCEHRILRSDIGVITNVRTDHVAEMGSSLEEVCDALSNTIPRRGKLFTCEQLCLPRLRERAEELETEVFAVGTPPAENSEPITGTGAAHAPFPENIALAEAVCGALGVDSETARRGMNNVKPDPYEASMHILPGGRVFINGMSANDPVSTQMVFERFTAQLGPEKTENRVFVLNCRPDRGYRTKLMMDYIREARPDEVWLMGSGSVPAARRLNRTGVSKVGLFKKAAELPLDSLPENTVVYAIGNIANEGIELMNRIGEEEAYNVR